MEEQRAKFVCRGTQSRFEAGTLGAKGNQQQRHFLGIVLSPALIPIFRAASAASTRKRGAEASLLRGLSETTSGATPQNTL